MITCFNKPSKGFWWHSSLKSPHYATPWLLVFGSLSCHFAFEPWNVSEVLYYNPSGLITNAQRVVSSDKPENIVLLMTKITLLLFSPPQRRMAKQPRQPVRWKAKEELNWLSKSNCLYALGLLRVTELLSLNNS